MFVVILVRGKRYKARHSQQIDAVSNGWTVIDDIDDDDRVIAKAYGDQPIARDVVEDAPRLLYLADLSHPNAGILGKELGVGFPRSCVFRFDSGLFESLAQTWAATDSRRLSELWKLATPL